MLVVLLLARFSNLSFRQKDKYVDRCRVAHEEHTVSKTVHDPEVPLCVGDRYSSISELTPVSVESFS